jgi:lipopolysaccharide transport system permease protein
MENFSRRIKPPSGFNPGFRELWQYRELLYFFTWRNIRVKYKQTILGILWAILQPLGLMLIFVLIFSRSWKIDTTPISYPVFVLAGLILWNLFYASVSQASESMIENARIIRKVYFPRLIIPGSSILTALFDFLFAALVFVVFCFIYHQSLGWQAIYLLPAAILLTLLTALGCGIFLSALTVRYRDFRYIIPFFLQFLFFASQVIYPLAGFQQSWARSLLGLNPMNAGIELFRGALNGGMIDMNIVWEGTLFSFLLMIAGIFFFKKTESYFADLV